MSSYDFVEWITTGLDGHGIVRHVAGRQNSSIRTSARIGDLFRGCRQGGQKRKSEN